MFAILLFLRATSWASVSGNVTLSVREMDSATDNIVCFKERNPSPIGIMTTSAGASISYNDATNSLNTNLILNEYYMDALTHITRERIPERLVHAKGGGAFGYFKVTRDITRYCKAKLFSKVGKKTPVAVRFSSVIAEKGGSDVSRDVRGFAVKFYTENGNFDIVGSNTPMYVYKDPLRFISFVHAIKRNPATDLRDINTFWDFLTLNPESIHIFLLIFGDRGISASYANMPGFSIHTYPVIGKNGDIYYVRFHFIPDAGIKNLFVEEAMKIGVQDPDYYNRILYRSIATGQFPSWTVSAQILTSKDIKKDPHKKFDTTRVLPKNEYPLHEVGKLVLNRNPQNYFADIEQLAFCPSNLVHGILGEPTKIYEARRLAYRDAQYYRLGANFNKIPVNCPYRTKTYTYNRDGRPPVKDNEKDIPNYYPNSFNGPIPYMDTENVNLIDFVEKPEPDNYEQATELYINEMTSDERTRLVENLVTSLRLVTEIIQQRALLIFYKIHVDLGNQVERGLKVNTTLLT